MAATTLAAPRRRRIPWGTIGLWLALLPLTFITLVPIAYMLSQAFTPEQDTMVWPIRWIPERPTVDNFVRIFNDPTLPVLRWFMNSMIVASSVTALVLFLSSLSAYAYARLEFPGRDAIFFLLLTSLMIPGAVTLIPVFLLLRDVKFLDSYHAVIWPAGAGVFGVFLLRQQFTTIPQELEEAGVMDGANRFRIYWQICLPLVRSAMVALGILTFLGSWNDLFWPLIVLSDRINLTLPVGLAVLGQGNYVQRGLTMAAAVIASAPPLILYAIFQRRIIAGVSTSGLAGR
ncbi:MAG TPA: carbohydrate ABC transporter permease [Roseiflexaceae bacterium]|nr:carbohydrate ABC transporter permease [Roseiflexaceae bacterium]